MKSILSINVRWEQDETADLDHLEGLTAADYTGTQDQCEQYAKEDAERLAAYHAGDWHMEGCWAVAKVVVDGTCQTIRSAGLWGIESDSDDGYRREVEEEEREALLNILESLGFDVRKEKAA